VADVWEARFRLSGVGAFGGLRPARWRELCVAQIPVGRAGLVGGAGSAPLPDFEQAPFGAVLGGPCGWWSSCSGCLGSAVHSITERKFGAMNHDHAVSSARAGDFGRRASSLLAAVTLISLGACSSINPMAVEARFNSVGGAIQPLRLPDPDSEDVHRRGLSLRIDSQLAQEDSEFSSRFAAALRQASDGRYESMRGVEGKDAQFEIFITEMNESNGFEKSEVGGVAGALAGAGTGLYVARNNPWLGIGAGAFGGYLLGELLFGENRDAFIYQVEFRQRTSAAGRLDFDDVAENSGSQGIGGMGDDEIHMAAMRVQKSVDKAVFDTTTNVAREVRYFGILVDGGALSGKDARRAEARRIMLERVPGWLMGGQAVAF